MIAKCSSLCPMCGVYVAKGRSHVSRLPTGIPVQPQRWGRLRDGWGDYDPDTDGRLRAWVHERCYVDGLAVVGQLYPTSTASVTDAYEARFAAMQEQYPNAPPDVIDARLAALAAK